jgi:predicted RNase H-like nuclease (RuvC/YqgF family)
MTDILSLEQLVHLSLGDPEAGAVNFNVLKTLLLQMLKAMNLFNYKPTMSDDDQRTLKEALSTTTASTQHVESEQDERSNSDNEVKRKSQRKKRDQSSDRLNALEEKVFRFESQVNALNQIPSNSELIDRAKHLPRKTSDIDNQAKSTHRQGPILEVWQYTQMEKRIESAENGITRVDLLKEPTRHVLCRSFFLACFITSRSYIGYE